VLLLLPQAVVTQDVFMDGGKLVNLTILSVLQLVAMINGVIVGSFLLKPCFESRVQRANPTTTTSTPSPS